MHTRTLAGEGSKETKTVVGALGVVGVRRQMGLSGHERVDHKGDHEAGDHQEAQKEHRMTASTWERARKTGSNFRNIRSNLGNNRSTFGNCRFT